MLVKSPAKKKWGSGHFIYALQVLNRLNIVKNLSYSRLCTNFVAEFELSYFPYRLYLCS